MLSEPPLLLDGEEVAGGAEADEAEDIGAGVEEVEVGGLPPVELELALPPGPATDVVMDPLSI